MAAKRSFEPSPTLRIVLPTFVIAGLASVAWYLGAPPASQAEAQDLAVTGSSAEVAAADVAGAVFSAPQISGTVTPEPATASNGCELVNGFTLTVLSGQPTCAEMAAVAKPYTDAVLTNSLGRELLWSESGWQCVRNYDSTGITANAHGLVCDGAPGTFLLVSE